MAAQGSDVESKLSVGTDEVEVNFEDVVSGGSVAASELQPSNLPIGAFASVEWATRTTSVDGSRGMLVGKIFDITVSNSFRFSGNAEITIPYDESSFMQSGLSESDVRLLHYDGKKWEDVTLAIDIENNTVTGRLTSFSPVTAAIVEDGTFGESYFEEHPLTRVIDLPGNNVSNTNGASSPGIISLLDSSGEPVNTVKTGSSAAITNTLKNLQRAPQQCDYAVEILDSDGVVIDLTVQSMTLQAGETRTMTQNWSANNAGDYTVKIFLIEGLNSQAPILLKDVSFKGFNVA
jgi:hypothetical protein